MGKWTREEKAKFARSLRENPTESEQVAYEWFRRNGVNFEPQKVLFGWIVDAYLPESRTVIEIDGWYHEPIGQKDKDLCRDAVFRSREYRVFRFSDYEVERSGGEALNVAVTDRDFSPSQKTELGYRAKEILKEATDPNLPPWKTNQPTLDIRRKAADWIRRCRVCSKSFQSRNPAADLCSPECEREHFFHPRLPSRP